jgi:UTP--glucose-1-phosphate uridylyltransferase
MPSGYYSLTLPDLLRRDPLGIPAARRAELAQLGAATRSRPELAGTVQALFDRLVPSATTATHESRLAEVLEELGFDRPQHEAVRADLRSGRIGLAQNRLPIRTSIEDALAGDVTDLAAIRADGRLRRAGSDLIRSGGVAVVTMAAGVGSRWTEGSGAVKAINPFCKLAGKHRTFLEIHLAKSGRVGREHDSDIPHVVTTSYLTHEPIERFLELYGSYAYAGPLILSPGRAVGLRLIPMVRDLRFAWEEMPQQILDEQAQKVRESLRGALIRWAQQAGEGSDYSDNAPLQCLHPVGHWYEVPNLLRNGVLTRLLEDRPGLQVLLLHNVDTVGTDVDPSLLAWHLESGAAMTVEVIRRRLEDRGGGLARVDGRLRLVEGLAMPREEDEFRLSFYNTGTMWISVDRLLDAFGLARADLRDEARVAETVRGIAARMPTYVTLKDVKRRWGAGQEDVMPVAQFERLWGDMTALPGFECRYVEVPRVRGQQLKEVAQLDGWLRDGSADYASSICGF